MINRPTQRIVDQRIRNRIIEALELASSFKGQLEYQARVPIADVPAEVLCSWSDVVRGPEDIEGSEPPVYTLDERAAMLKYHDVWNSVCLDVRQGAPSLSELQTTRPWMELRNAASNALAVFLLRGKLSEEIETP